MAGESPGGMQLLVADTELEEGASYELHFAALYCTQLQLSLAWRPETRPSDVSVRGGGTSGPGGTAGRRISYQNIFFQFVYTSSD